MLRMLPAAAVLVLGCAGATPQTAPTPDEAGDCGGRYALTVRNEALSGRVWAYYADVKLLKPGAMLGDVGPGDERTFFFRYPETPAAWAQVEGIRVFPMDRAAQQRLRVRVALTCDDG